MSVMMTLTEAAQCLGVAPPPSAAAFSSVSSDSRRIQAGQLFVALVGEQFDGHDFVPAALAQGAAGALVNAAYAKAAAASNLIAVADTRQALAALAGAWRARRQLPVIGVVGSNGKTTTKEMCAAILRAAYGEAAVLATVGNLNNDIGVPTMLLRLTAAHRAAVIEIGMNHPGETAQLAHITGAGIALITNAQREHQEFMKTVAAVAQEHALLIDALPDDGVAVFPAGDVYAPLWTAHAAQRGSRRVLDFGLGAGAVNGIFNDAGFGGQLTLRTPWGETEIALQVPGAHNARNACAAAAACLAGGVPLAAVAQGLGAFNGVKGRLQRRPAAGDYLLIDDSYNANPDSMRAAIDVLAQIPGRRIFVMGDMGEVGDAAGQLHDEVGGYAKSRGIDRLLCLGEHAGAAARNFGLGGEHFARGEDLLKVLRGELDARTSVLVKGSRFMKMERIADALAAPATPATPIPPTTP